MKRFVFWALYLLGVPALFRFFHRKSLTIVLYHGVAPQISGLTGIYNYGGKFVQPKHFARQLAYFKKHYTVMPLDTALDLLAKGALPERTLAITFDDGYANFYEHALPLLTQAQLPATMFLATDFVLRRTPLWVDRLEYACGKRNGTYAERIAFDARTRNAMKQITPAAREEDLQTIEGSVRSVFHDFESDRAVYAPLTQEQIAASLAAGMSFGVHTRSHPILSMLSADNQDEEIVGSRADFATWNIPASPTFAYPNGHREDWNEYTVNILQSRGFPRALTTIEGTNTKKTPPYELRRMVLDDTGDRAKFANVVSGVRLFLNRFR